MMAGRPAIDPVIDGVKLFEVPTRRAIARACRLPTGRSVQEIAKAINRPPSAIKGIVENMHTWKVLRRVGTTSRGASTYALSERGDKLHREWIQSHPAGFDKNQTIVWIDATHTTDAARALLDGDHDRAIAFAVFAGRPPSLLVAFLDEIAETRLQTIAETLGAGLDGARVTKVVNGNDFRSFVEGFIAARPEKRPP